MNLVKNIKKTICYITERKSNISLSCGNTFKRSKDFKSKKFSLSVSGKDNMISIGRNFNSKDCKINIGNKTSFYKTEISTYDNGSEVEIGEDCMFAFDTIIYNTDGHSIFQNGNLINKADKLVIGDHVWCGWGSTILKNSYIPSGCIVGKSAVVAKKFEKENVVIAGNPAKIIKENILWDRKSVNETRIMC